MSTTGELDQAGKELQRVEMMSDEESGDVMGLVLQQREQAVAA